MVTRMTFGNRSLGVHLVLGVLGFGSLVLSLQGHNVIGWQAVPGVSMWALNGCPLYRAIGLFEMPAAKVFALADQVT